MLANLKAALAARGMRQVDLALELKIDPSLLSQVVNERKKAGPSLRGRIAATLQADEQWLFSSVAHIPKPSGSSVGSSPVPPIGCSGHGG